MSGNPVITVPRACRVNWKATNLTQITYYRCVFTANFVTFTMIGTWPMYRSNGAWITPLTFQPQRIMIRPLYDTPRSRHCLHTETESHSTTATPSQSHTNRDNGTKQSCHCKVPGNRLTTACGQTVAVNNTYPSALGDFTFWISLFAQSEIRTERKLNQKVKSIFLFGLSLNFGLNERLS